MRVNVHEGVSPILFQVRKVSIPHEFYYEVQEIKSLTVSFFLWIKILIKDADIA